MGAKRGGLGKIRRVEGCPRRVMGHCKRHVVIPETENMKTKANSFNADDLVGSVEAFVSGAFV